MSDRLNTNGNFSRIAGPGSATTDSQANRFGPAPQSHAESNIVTARLESLVKSAPGKSLLVALAAGLIIGFWVKRK